MRFTRQAVSEVEPVASTFESRMNQTGNVPYFPPPPTTPGTEIKKPDRKQKPSLQADIAPKVTAPHRPRKRSSLRHSVGYPTSTRRRRLREVHLPAITLSPRHWILVGLMLLSFLVLILGFIFADCVALPHTDKGDGTTGDDIPSNITLYVRQAGSQMAASPAGNAVTIATQEVDNTGTTTSEASNPNSSAAPASQTNGTTTPSEYLANESKRMGFDSPKNLAILFFYTATLPLLTILHTIIEIIVLCCAQRCTSSYSKFTDDKGPESDNDNDNDDDSITKLKPLSLVKKHPSRSGTSNSNSRISALLPYLPALSFTASTLLILGWIAINAIQLHCEIPIPSLQKTLQSPANMMICPVQARGHFMHGIHELSIVKNVFGWVLVVMYIAYAAWCARVNGLVWRAAREERRARKLRVDLEGKREEQLRGSVVRFAVVEEGVSVEKKGSVVGVREL